MVTSRHSRRPSPSWRCGWVSLLLAAAGCVPGELDVTGKRCSDERGCGEGFLCVAQVCQLEGFDGGAAVDAGLPDASVDAGLPDAGASDGSVDAGPVFDGGPGFDSGFPLDVQLLGNGGFELVLPDAGLRLWQRTAGLVGPAPLARTGSSAGRMTAVGLVTPAMQSETVGRRALLGMLFCAEAWVRADTDAGPTSALFIRERRPDGGLDTSGGTSVTAQSDGWRVMQEEFVTLGGGVIDVRITNTRLPPDASVFVDDVLLFRASGTFCAFP
jgi:hypothetical protein